MARGRGHASARKRRAAFPVLTPHRQRAVTCHRVQVRGAKLHLFIIGFRHGHVELGGDYICYYVSVLHLYPPSLSPVGCLLTEWSPWSDCSAICGGGLSVRNKTVLREPEPGGMACVGPLEQHIVCNTNSCLPGNRNTHIIKSCKFSTFTYYIIYKFLKYS